MNRFEEQKQLLETARFFKVVCGAGNEDAEEVRRLALVYTLAGAKGIDVSANVEVVKAAMKGIDRAFKLSSALNIELETRPFITVSVGLKGDPHVRKANINGRYCSNCRLCEEECDQNAIYFHNTWAEYEVNEKKCIGCGKCADVCPENAIEFYTKKVDFKDILPKCLEAGAENIELHAIIEDDEEVMKDWKTITRILPDHYVSMCLDRSQLSNTHLIERIKQAFCFTKDRLIIQVDGAPMSGSKDDFNTTLQAVAIADIVQKSKIPVKILLSGGTNSKTGDLAIQCGLRIHGVSIGTFARNIIREELLEENFEDNREVFFSALSKARALVVANLHWISR